MSWSYLGLLFLTDACSERYSKRVLGNTEIKDALQELDRLTQEEARMASAELLKITHGVDDRVKDVNERIQEVGADVHDVGETVRDVVNKVQDIDSDVKDTTNKVTRCR